MQQVLAIHATLTLALIKVFAVRFLEDSRVVLLNFAVIHSYHVSVAEPKWILLSSEVRFLKTDSQAVIRMIAFNVTCF